MELARKAGELARAAGWLLRGPLDARIVFLHVPKCGGHSVRSALREAYGWPLRRGRRRYFDVVQPRSGRAARMVGGNALDLRDDLARYHMCDHRIRLVTGQLRWPEALRREFPDLAVVSMLRDPVSHFLSRYFYQRENVQRRDAITDDLASFLDSELALATATQFVTRFAGLATPRAALEPGAVELAQRRLAEADVVGVLEDVPGFVDAFEERFGARLRIPHLNASRSRPQRESVEVPAAIRQRIAELVRPNQEVYDFVRERRGRRPAPSR